MSSTWIKLDRHVTSSGMVEHILERCEIVWYFLPFFLVDNMDQPYNKSQSNRECSISKKTGNYNELENRYFTKLTRNSNQVHGITLEWNQVGLIRR